MTTYNNIDFTDKSALQALIVTLLEEAKALDIYIHHFSHGNDIAESAVLCSARSSRHTHAIAHQLEKGLRRYGLRHAKIQGDVQGEWLVMDLGGIVIHVMQPQVRSYYQLETLWTHPSIAAKSNDKRV